MASTAAGEGSREHVSGLAKLAAAHDLGCRPGRVLGDEAVLPARQLRKVVVPHMRAQAASGGVSAAQLVRIEPAVPIDSTVTRKVLLVTVAELC